MARTSVSNVLLLLLSVMLLGACSPDTEQRPAGIPNVILFVGDGFGATQMSLGIQYARLVEQRELNIDSLMQDGNTGYSLPLPFDNIVIDSAAAATQMATGQLARNDMLGLDP
ncbi:MAG: alkaline phosphatase, partial [Woeseiaceae bacterium]